MTLNGCTTLSCTYDASFGAYRRNVKEYKLMLSATDNNVAQISTDIFLGPTFMYKTSKVERS